MSQLSNSNSKMLLMATLFGCLLGSPLYAETGIEISNEAPSPMVVWDSVDESKPSEMAVDQQQPVTAKDMEVTSKEIMEGVARPAEDVVEPSDGVYREEPIEKYLEPTMPPANTSKIVDIFLENKSMSQGFLSGFTTKRADIDLKLQQHQPSDIPLTSKFQIANFGNYIRLGHEETGRLIGYSTNYFGFTSVYLEKEYYEPQDFWTRFIVAPSGQKDWYLIRSYTNPKKCLTIGWSDKLRLKRCNIKDKWQQWRFLREKADAYWVPNTELINLDII